MEETVHLEDQELLDRMAGIEEIFLPEDPDEEAFITDDDAMDFAS